MGLGNLLAQALAATVKAHVALTAPGSWELLQGISYQGLLATQHLSMGPVRGPVRAHSRKSKFTPKPIVNLVPSENAIGMGPPCGYFVSSKNK